MTQDLKSTIETQLATALESAVAAAPTKSGKLLVGRIKQSIMRAGKRTRPLLLYLTYQAYGGSEHAALQDIAVALELYHQSLLVHDDIMDQDVIRYDAPNLLGKYLQDFPAAESNIAPSSAMLGGNILYALACQKISRNTTLEDSQKVALLDLWQDVQIAEQYGQQLDIYNVMSQPACIAKTSSRLLIQIDALKTAPYSVQLPMDCAAILLDLDTSERKRIDRFATLFGIVYQMADDYSDYFGNDSVFKTHPKYRDFKQGKLTYPLLYALQHASEQDKRILQLQAGRKDIDEAAMHRVVRILADIGAQEVSRQLLETYFQRTVTALNNLNMQALPKQEFASLLAKHHVA